ncbi:MAG TPA: NTP transferase domain-containing protein [Bacteroidia bacterium]
MDCRVLILGGGKSERMNSPKPFLKYGNRAFIEKIIGEFSTCNFSEIVVVLNHELLGAVNEENVSKISGKCIVVKNDNPEMGRYHSIKLGINKIIGADFCFIHNVDNPFVSSSLIKELYKNRNENGYTLPVYKDRGGHPVLLSKKIIETIHEDILTLATLKDVLKNFNRKELVVNDERILININTPEEYQQEMIKQKNL